MTIRAWKSWRLGLLPLFVCCIVALAAADARAELSSKQARKAITRMPGFELTSGAVRVKAITPGTPAEVTADIRTVFKFEQDDRRRWRIVEIRTAQDRWESINFMTDPAHADLATDDLESALELLTDVPVGKLAIAEASHLTREQVVELERRGMDAVIVPARNVAELVGGAPPAV